MKAPSFLKYEHRRFLLLPAVAVFFLLAGVSEPAIPLPSPGPFVYNDFDLTGLEITDWSRTRYIQPLENVNNGVAEQYFIDETGKYDITIFCNGFKSSSIELFINEKSIGTINSGRQKVFPGVNIQQWSRLKLVFTVANGEKVLFDRLQFMPAGAYEGKTETISRPLTPWIFETREERAGAAEMLDKYIKVRLDDIAGKRMNELASFKNPAEWKARQQMIRERLPQYFGKFPEKTPLNAKTVGKIEHELYTIEKVIFESQPGYFVPSTLFIPKARKFPVPGVIVPCGHYNDAKSYEDYHKVGLGLVLKGYVALIYDPMGQGERVEYFDPATLKTIFVDGGYYGVDEHHYVGKPAFLAGWTLSGLRTWDGIRAIDYLVSRPEVNKDQLASFGNSGGGIMSMIITSVDERIKVCVASHPGGSCEEFFLSGQELIRSEILSLIPPRPLRITVGIDSGEEPSHKKKLDDIQLFYEGLRCGKESGDLEVVPGIHSMSRPNREAAYDWLNKWFDRQYERKEEAELNPEKKETIWCTDNGNIINSLKGETGQSLNGKLIDKIYHPSNDQAVLKEKIAARIMFSKPEIKIAPEVESFGKISFKGLNIEKLTLKSEDGIVMPALLIKPASENRNGAVYLFTSDDGKPDRLDAGLLPFTLAMEGNTVLALDVRGTGETSPTPKIRLTKNTGYSTMNWRHDSQALQSLTLGRTMTGMRVFDMIRAVDYIKSINDLKDKKIIVAGEGQGGVWSLMTAAFDNRISGVVTIGTLPSYKPLLTNHLYNSRGYFWVPGALYDYDIPDLARLVSPRSQVWINPVDHLGNVDVKLARSFLGSEGKIKVVAAKDAGEAVRSLK